MSLVDLNLAVAASSTEVREVDLPCDSACSLDLTVYSTEACGNTGWLKVWPEHLHPDGPPVAEGRWFDTEQLHLDDLPCTTLHLSYGNEFCEDVDRIANYAGEPSLADKVHLRPIATEEVTVLDDTDSTPIAGVRIRHNDRTGLTKWTDGAGQVTLRTDLRALPVFTKDGYMTLVPSLPRLAEAGPVTVTMERARLITVWCADGDMPCPGRTEIVSHGTKGWAPTPCTWKRPGLWLCPAVDSGFIEAQIGRTERRVTVPKGASQVHIDLSEVEGQVCVEWRHDVDDCTLSGAVQVDERTVSIGQAMYRPGTPLPVDTPIGSPLTVFLSCEGGQLHGRAQATVREAGAGCAVVQDFEDAASACLTEAARAEEDACWLRLSEGASSWVTQLDHCPALAPPGVHDIYCGSEHLGSVVLEAGTSVDVP